MYTVTFYSYKGGVGRTMSLVNVAYELAKSGKKVLILDFDLEAPGVHTFPLLNCDTSRPGLVDYVHEYISNATAPEIGPYVQQCQVNGMEGAIHLLSGGAANEEYSDRLQRISWVDLYENYRGYELFEDIKLQIEETLGIDYLLIDSRTGMTDVGGICTRHLPDMVAVVFYPNEQNYVGLRHVVPLIRKEAVTKRNRPIELLFVASNLPDIDDEGGILKRRLEQFTDIMNCDEPDARIRHYPSLELIDQQIFTKDRRETRLAKEYIRFSDAIRQKNPEDREGSISFISSVMREMNVKTSVSRSENEAKDDDHIRFIEQYHPKDGEVLFQLGKYHQTTGNLDKALQLYNKAIERGVKNGEIFARRSGLHFGNFNQEDALKDAWFVLSIGDVSPRDFMHAVYLIRHLNSEGLPEIVEMPAYHQSNIVQRLRAISAFDQTTGQIQLSARLMWKMYTQENDNWPVEFNMSLIHALIHCGRFEDALSVLDGIESGSEKGIHDINMAFDKAICLWGMNKKLDKEYFSKVIMCFKEMMKHHPDSANYHQCISIAFWAVGEVANALHHLDIADNIISRFGGPESSAWSYSEVSQLEFRQHLQEMKKMFSGEDIVPMMIGQRAT